MPKIKRLRDIDLRRQRLSYILQHSNPTMCTKCINDKCPPPECKRFAYWLLNECSLYNIAQFDDRDGIKRYKIETIDGKNQLLYEKKEVNK
jgi:hypothetical protein